MAHFWDEYLAKVHKAVPVDPWATNVQLLDVFIHERSSSASCLPAWLHTKKAPMARVGSMLTLGVKNSHIQKEVANADGGTTFSQSINKDGTSAGLQASETNMSNSDDAAAIIQPVSGELSIYNSLVIKATSMPDMQTTIRSSTSLLASFTGGSAASGQFDVKGSKTVKCNIGGVKSRWVDMDALMELVTPRTSSSLPPLWHPDIFLPQLQWSSKRGQLLWVVVEIMCANKIEIEADNQAQANAKATVSKGEEINVSDKVDLEKDGMWTVIAAKDNPTFPFALRLLKLDYDACGNIITTQNKECLRRKYSLNKRSQHVSSKHVVELHHS